MSIDLRTTDSRRSAVPAATQDDRAFPASPGAWYAVGGGLVGLIAFAPAAWLAWVMLGCWGRTAGCEYAGPGLIAMLVATVALLVPIAGGFVSAFRGEPRALELAGTAAFAVVAVEWILVLGAFA